MPKDVPMTRVEMKRLLEQLKARRPRLPLPPRADEPNTADARRSGRSSVNNGRMRQFYLPPSWLVPPQSLANRATQSPLDDAFKTRLFWVVSRINNCHYCLGHQEQKLLNAGMLEDDIAALDFHWQHFSAADQAALALARAMTLNPHRIEEVDLDSLRVHFNDRELVEIVFTIASNNSTNRWTDSLGIPQDERFRDTPLRLDSPTSEGFRSIPSEVAVRSALPRGPLPGVVETMEQLEACRQRKPRVAFPADATRGDLEEHWLRMLGYLPETAENYRVMWTAVAHEGRIPAVLKAELAWCTARENRAWYATAYVLRRLERLGVSADTMFARESALETADLPNGHAAALAFARKLTSHPQSISDADIESLRGEFSDHEVAEIVYVVCLANWFDRFTETLYLPAE